LTYSTFLLPAKQQHIIQEEPMENISIILGDITQSRVDAIAFDPYTHGFYRVTERVGEAFKDGLKLKK